MKKLLFGLLLAGALLQSCKKTSNTSTSGGTGGSGNNNTGSASACDGLLIVTKSVTIIQPNIVASGPDICQAYFSSTPTPVMNTATYVKVNNVSVNGASMKFLSYNYQDTTYSVTAPPATWVVNGLGSIPSFTYTNTDPFPTSNQANLPDTIYKSQPLTVQVTGVANANEVYVIISDQSGLIGHAVSQKLVSGSTSVTFPATSFASLNAGQVSVDIDCIKNNVQSLGGKSFNFQNSFQVVEMIQLK